MNIFDIKKMLEFLLVCFNQFETCLPISCGYKNFFLLCASAKTIILLVESAKHFIQLSLIIQWKMLGVNIPVFDCVYIYMKWDCT